MAGADPLPRRGSGVLHALERVAVGGLLAGIGCLAVDAALHYRTRFYSYLPRMRPGRNHWTLVVRLWHRRPALTLGLCLLCLALLLALGVMVAALVRSIVTHPMESPVAERADQDASPP
jgi:hypothetical protein